MTATLLLAAAWTALGVYPYPIEKRNPLVEPPDAKPVKVLEAFAAQGEYEAAAFQLKPAEALRRVDLQPSALKGSNGATIAADEIDVKVVKYWWRPWNSWETDRIGDLTRLELTPDMLLHDDSLVKADEKDQVNYIRADYETGSVYLNMRERGRGRHFNYSLEPVHDAPKFVPLDLEKGRYREFFVTFHAPYGTPAGVYEGRLAVVADGRPCGSLGLRLTVYPFELPRARTHYDTSREYRLMMFNNMALSTFLAGGKDLAKAERRLRNTITECAKHNFLYPAGGACEVKSVDTDDLGVRTLLIYRECGLPCDPIVTGRACERKWMEKKVGDSRATPENDAAALRETIIADFLPYVDRQLSASERFFGHRNWFFFGRDEAGPGTQRIQTGFWRAVKDRGAGVFATTMGPMYRQVSWLDDLADVAARCSYSFAGGWHAGGAKCYTYAGTFCGVECPDVWRRSKGIRFYFADFDGLCDYIFFREDIGNHWNGLQPTDSGYRRMLSVFPTEDGFVTTVQFEGYREALDDVRYYSLLRLLAEKAIRSGDAAKRAAGREAIAWFDSTDPEFVFDLDAFRREVAARIVKLQGLVGPWPSERIAPGKPLPPCGYGRNLPPNADKLKLAGGFAKEDRYDLAVPLYEAVRTDKAQPLDTRVTAAVAEAKLLASTKRRDRAVKVLEDLLPEAADAALRRKLLFAKFDAMLEDVVFEERLTAERLASARKVYGELSALVGPKGRGKDLAGPARKFIDCAGYGRHAALVKEFAAVVLADARLEKFRGSLLSDETIALAAADDLPAATACGQEAEKAGAEKLDRGTKRRFYLAFAESAAKTGDRALAARVYRLLSDCYSPEGEAGPLHRRYLKLSERYSKPEEMEKEKK